MGGKLRLCLAGLLGALLAALIILYYVPDTSDMLTLHLQIAAEEKDNYQLFYLREGEADYGEDRAGTDSYAGGGKEQALSFSMPLDTKTIRLDLGTQPADITFLGAYVTYEHHRTDLKADLFASEKSRQQIASIEKTDKGYEIVTEGNDPYCIIDFTEAGESLEDFFGQAANGVTWFYKIVLSLLIFGMLLAAAALFPKVYSLLAEVWHSRTLMMRLAKNDFKTRYAGSYLGIIWAFIQPIVTVVVYWFVFQVGFRSGGVSEYPYVLWLISGLIPWFFFSESWNSATGSMLEYSYLVKKVVFKISILPIVKIISALFVHLFFICFLIFMFCLYGYWPDIYVIQVFYYSFCMIMLVLGLSYLTCSIVIFFRDLGQIINIILQVGVWMTPIMWNVTMLGNDIRWIMKLNPMYYVVYGYRGALMDKVWFFEDLPLTVYFWSFTLIMFGVGTLIFKKLKIHFADVL